MMNLENIENINSIVGPAFEDLTELELVHSQGVEEIQLRTWGAAGVSFAISWNVSNAIFGK